MRFGEVRDFPLADLLDLPGASDEEADLEGMAVADGFLWVVGSHGLKRKNTKPDRNHADNAKRLAKVSLDGNRRLLACLPIEVDTHGEPHLVRKAKDGRQSMRLKGDSQQNLLTRALADDPHFGPYMTIPGKDNGFDIEGLAVGETLELDLREFKDQFGSAFRAGGFFASERPQRLVLLQIETKGEGAGLMTMTVVKGEGE